MRTVQQVLDSSTAHLKLYMLPSRSDCIPGFALHWAQCIQNVSLPSASRSTSSTRTGRRRPGRPPPPAHREPGRSKRSRERPRARRGAARAPGGPADSRGGRGRGERKRQLRLSLKARPRRVPGAPHLRTGGPRRTTPASPPCSSGQRAGLGGRDGDALRRRERRRESPDTAGRVKGGAVDDSRRMRAALRCSPWCGILAQIWIAVFLQFPTF